MRVIASQKQPLPSKTRVLVSQKQPRLLRIYVRLASVSKVLCSIDLSSCQLVSYLQRLQNCCSLVRFTVELGSIK